ncbi:MAG: membrane-bound serine protease (ClpP class) [Bacteroidia bacterium]|jgi:membrane-bound serine protease (ClpP class)
MLRFIWSAFYVLVVTFAGYSQTDSLEVSNQTDSISAEEIADSLQVAGIEKVYIFDIKDEIGPAVWRRMNQAFDEAQEWDSDLILIHMNTYGGMVVDADSMRTKILNSEIPVWVYIDNNAASAGALISIACDSIFMSNGANIGAATVVNQEGEKLMDKYQSYMRSTMRSTAESKGRDTKIAEAMVDESIYIEGLIDSTKILTMTASEASENGYCEGIFESIPELLLSNGIIDAETRTYEVSSLESLIGMLVNPAVSGVLIMIIIGGIYFELQSPGVGFPIIASVIAASLYFAPLYLEGFAENWEIVLFVLGVVLLGVEVFVIPGFGLAGAAGIAFMVSGLILSLIYNVGFNFEFALPSQIYSAFFTVIISTVFGMFGSFWLAKRLFTATALSNMVLSASQPSSEGFVGVDQKEASFIGEEGTAYTVMRPSGKVMINDQLHDATALTGYIDKGEKVKVVKFETAQLFVRKV